MVKENIENETPEDKFRRIATVRTIKIIEKIRILSNCADKRRYKYTKNQISRIFETIQTELNQAKSKFDTQEEIQFKL